MISAPEDYGLTPEQTLSHTIAGAKPDDFDTYWAAFREEVETLPTRFEGAIDGEVNPVVIPSLRSVRIAGRLTMPPGEPRGIVITTHGYAPEPAFPAGPEPWGEPGMITLRVRVRGFAPSTLDMPDLGAQWILHKIESAESWVARGAVADVVQAFRCARRRWPDLPISLHGESFGGGLTIIAAAQLQAMGESPFRLAIGLPSFGDWRWRAGRYCNGAGGLVNSMLEAMRQESESLMRVLLLFDAAIHAQSVTIPTLCKLACADDCVPAPSAAAVYNAIASREKWPFVIRYGHFEGGLADLRRHVCFERLHRSFLDPRHPPGQAAVQPLHPDWREPALKIGPWD